ncbi:hypothetical protein E6O75_ATG00685 [Venturia nashicola]|uniref:Uncharacterized protein n=1 Tax=Venturia nashicola TaxID=86259 RepID=A0A4Z1PUC7_9PEZI|nr:hypothetical protein E6O75_ATG00685 [Venturia nashicola]
MRECRSHHARSSNSSLSYFDEITTLQRDVRSNSSQPCGLFYARIRPCSVNVSGGVQEPHSEGHPAVTEKRTKDSQGLNS